ncbi:unnamed protein product [Moneuplotes crassus]|uniref:NADPH:adrenodoxin oxidoreductase, mitochondrial n=1 Tax=Euplotes crassus TaxID=5936 RepID=A0AAD1UAM1_EUPCR|nr:unnamed protein product [Moneuplotes crassus]
MIRGPSARAFLPNRAFCSQFYTSDNYNPKFKDDIRKKNQIRSDREYTFCIIGSGPAGFYTAKSLLKSENGSIKVDILDSSPHPYGLVRNGVAPDHQSMKKIQYDYDEVFKNKNCQFYGNVTVGEDIQILDLLRNYSGVILAYGAGAERDIGIEGEHHLTSATDIINWYNGKLDYFQEFQDSINFDMKDLRDISVIGNGNVATDLARIFLKTKEELKDSDMPSPVMDILKEPEINSVSLVARRGIYQSAFTTKEVRELSKLPQIKMYLFKEELEKSRNEASLLEATPGSSIYARAINRRTTFLEKTCIHLENNDHYEEVLNDSSHKKLFLRYFMSPSKVLDQNSIEFNITELEGEAEKQRCVVKSPEERVTLKSDLWLKSVGYKTIPMPGVPYDADTFTVPNEMGCVLSDNGEIIKGLYVCGWAKRGPVGIIDATLRDSFETYRVIKNHIDQDLLDSRIDSTKKTLYNLEKSFVTYRDWAKVMYYEDERGKKIGKPREKYLWTEDYENIIGKAL